LLRGTKADPPNDSPDWKHEQWHESIACEDEERKLVPRDVPENGREIKNPEDVFKEK